LEDSARKESSNLTRATIAIPVHNGGSFIEFAIKSAIAQDYENFEIIVVDNASTDHTPEVVSQFPEVQYFRFDDFVSMPANFNRSIELSNGMYIRLLCADDTLRSDCLRRSIEALQMNDSAVMCSSSETIVGGRELTPHRRTPNHLGLISGPQARLNLLRNGNLIGGPSSVTLLAKTYKEVLFREDLPCSFDLDAWVKILGSGDLIVLPEPLYESRVHPGQATNSCLRGGFQDDWVKILRNSRQTTGEPGILIYAYLRCKNFLSRFRQCSA
jgi:glycosyltransferase involved in cell wall biosynthesis